MQDLIKRYFWVLGAIAVVAVRRVRRQGDGPRSSRRSSSATPKQGPKITPVGARRTSPPVKPTRSKDGTPARDAQHVLLGVHARRSRRGQRRPVADPDHRRCRSSCSRPTSAPSARSSRTRRSSTPRARSRARSRSATRCRARRGKHQGDPLQVRRLREQRPHRAPRARGRGRPGHAGRRVEHARHRRRTRTTSRPRSTAASRRSTTTPTRSTSRSSTRCSRTRWRSPRARASCPR